MTKASFIQEILIFVCKWFSILPYPYFFLQQLTPKTLEKSSFSLSKKKDIEFFSCLCYTDCTAWGYLCILADCVRYFTIVDSCCQAILLMFRRFTPLFFCLFFYFSNVNGLHNGKIVFFRFLQIKFCQNQHIAHFQYTLTQKFHLLFLFFPCCKTHIFVRYFCSFFHTFSFPLLSDIFLLNCVRQMQYICPLFAPK